MDPITFAQLNATYHNGVYGQEETLDIQEWVEALIDEGYDLDQYTDEELYEAYKKMSGKRLSRVMGKVADLSRTSQKFASDTNVISQARRAGHTDKDVKRASQKYADRADRIISRIGEHDPEKVKARETQNRRTINVRATPVSRPSLSEDIDLYDLVSEYLVSEGFCDSYEDADVIMANMSEEWREIILDEARQEEGETAKRKRRIRRGRTPYGGGERGERIRQEWHKDSRGRRGESPLAAHPRYENEPGRRIRGKGYVSYETDD